MKKLIRAFLTICLLFGITACSASQPSEEIGGDKFSIITEEPLFRSVRQWARV